jgi:hypothetical protein
MLQKPKQNDDVRNGAESGVQEIEVGYQFLNLGLQVNQLGAGVEGVQVFGRYWVGVEFAGVQGLETVRRSLEFGVGLVEARVLEILR